MQGGYESDLGMAGALFQFMFLEYRRDKIRDIGNQFRRLNVRLGRIQENQNRKKDGNNDKTYFSKKLELKKKRNF